MKNASKKPKCFYCYLDNNDMIKQLSDDEAGKIWKALFEYAQNDVRPKFDNKLLSVLFSMFQSQVDRDFAKYAKSCIQNSINAKKRNQKSAVVNERKQFKATADNCSQKEYENENKDENEIEIENTPTAVDSRNAFDYQEVVDSFNTVCISLPKVQKLNDKRRKLMVNADKLLGEMTFDELFSLVESSDFLTGRNGKWSGCGFDWILNPANLTKIIEGNYINKESATVNTTAYAPRNYNEEF